MKPTYEQISLWMELNINSHIDPILGELNVEDLAECAAQHFGDSNGFYTPEMYVQIANDLHIKLLGDSYDYGF